MIKHERARIRRWFWWHVCSTDFGQKIYWNLGYRTLGSHRQGRTEENT